MGGKRCNRPARVKADRQRIQDRFLPLFGTAQLAYGLQLLGLRLQGFLKQLLFTDSLLLDLLGLFVKLDEHRNLRAQHHRVERLEYVVDSAGIVAAQHMRVFLVYGGQEDDRRALRLLALPNQCSRLVTIETRHQHIQQNYRKFLLQQKPQRFLSRLGAHYIAGSAPEPRGWRKGCVRRRQPPGPAAWACEIPPGATALPLPLSRLFSIASAWPARRSACSHQGLVEAARSGPCAADPHAQQGKKQIEVDGLGDIVGCACIETFLAIAFHRLGGDRDQGNVGNCRRIANLAHRLVSVHLWHHDIDEGDIHIGIFIQKGYPIASPLGVQNLDVVGLQHAGQRVDVTDVVIDDENLRAEQAGIVEPFVRLFGDVPTFRWKGRGNQQGKLCEILRARHIHQVLA